jgi:hypothetical protein
VRVKEVSGGAARGAEQLGAGGGRPWRSSWGGRRRGIIIFLILVMMSLDLGGLKFIYGTCRCTSPGSGVFAESRPRLSMERYAFNKGRAAKH